MLTAKPGAGSMRFAGLIASCFLTICFHPVDCSRLTSSRYFESPHLLVTLSGSRYGPMIAYPFPGFAYACGLESSRHWQDESTSTLQSTHVCLISLESDFGFAQHYLTSFSYFSRPGSLPGFVWLPGYTFKWSPPLNGQNSNP